MALEDLKNRNIDLSIEVDPNVPETISSDVNKLQQVILNLLLSIIKNK
jgi:signal transduction histidine kinase